MDKYGNFSMEDAKRIAESDAGRKLMALLQENNAQQLQSVMEQASAGNYNQVKDTLSAMLSSPEAQALLKQLGG